MSNSKHFGSKSICILALNGSVQDVQFPKDLQLLETYKIGVDGGTRFFLGRDIFPDLVIGDGDSLTQLELEQLELEQSKEAKVQIIRHPVDKDKTDLELALEYIQESDFETIYIVGASGGRIDHVLMNFFIISTQINKEKKIILLSDKTVSYLVRASESLQFEKSSGETLSLVLLSGDAEIASLTGVKWPLSNHTMKFGEGKTISNRIINNVAQIDVAAEKECILIVSQVKDNK